MANKCHVAIERNAGAPAAPPRRARAGAPSRACAAQIAVEGCCHGELDAIYDSIRLTQQQTGVSIDVLIICGDFQAVRNQARMPRPPRGRARTRARWYRAIS